MAEKSIAAWELARWIMEHGAEVERDVLLNVGRALGLLDQIESEDQVNEMVHGLLKDGEYLRKARASL